MATGLFGVSWTEIIDFLLKLAPAASIVGGILAARVQLRSNRQINAVMIAKNHYREMLDAFLKNTLLGVKSNIVWGVEEGYPALSSLSNALHAYVLRDAGALSGDGPEA